MLRTLLMNLQAQDPHEMLHCYDCVHLQALAVRIPTHRGSNCYHTVQWPPVQWYDYELICILGR